MKGDTYGKTYECTPSSSNWAVWHGLCLLARPCGYASIRDIACARCESTCAFGREWLRRLPPARRAALDAEMNPKMSEEAEPMPRKASYVNAEEKVATVRRLMKEGMTLSAAAGTAGFDYPKQYYSAARKVDAQKADSPEAVQAEVAPLPDNEHVPDSVDADAHAGKRIPWMAPYVTAGIDMASAKDAQCDGEPAPRLHHEDSLDALRYAFRAIPRDAKGSDVLPAGHGKEEDDYRVFRALVLVGRLREAMLRDIVGLIHTLSQHKPMPGNMAAEMEQTANTIIALAKCADDLLCAEERANGKAQNAVG